MAETLRITYRLGNRTPDGQVYEAWLGDRMVCKGREPFLAAARVLLGEGMDPATILESAHEGSDTVGLRATLATAAKLSVSETGTPHFVKYSPPPVHLRR